MTRYASADFHAVLALLRALSLILLTLPGLPLAQDEGAGPKPGPEAGGQQTNGSTPAEEQPVEDQPADDPEKQIGFDPVFGDN